VGHTQQGLDEFLNEVVLITGVRHRNLVKLNGCCLKGDRRLLVYEYVENNNLAEVLFGKILVYLTGNCEDHCSYMDIESLQISRGASNKIKLF